MRVMMTQDGFIENNRRRRGSDPLRDSFKLESLANFNHRCMVVVKASPEELKRLEKILADRQAGKTAPRPKATAPEIRMYKKEDFPDEAEVEAQTSDVKGEPSQYPMKKDKPKGNAKGETATGDQEVI